MGYTNIFVYEEGYPAWVAAYGSGQTLTVTAGGDEGVIDVAQFQQILSENPDSMFIVDVRDPEEFAAGTFPGAVNIPVGELEKRVDELPKDKPVVFVCTTGARSGESFWMVKDVRPEMDKCYFLDADVAYEGTTPTIVPRKQ